MVAVGDRHAGGLLAPVLLGEEPEVRQPRDVLFRGPYPEETASLLRTLSHVWPDGNTQLSPLSPLGPRGALGWFPRTPPRPRRPRPRTGCRRPSWGRRSRRSSCTVRRARRPGP